VAIFVEETGAIRDRLYVTAAVRSDQNSAFGTKFQRVFYPKASLSGSCPTRISSRAPRDSARSAACGCDWRTVRRASNPDRTTRSERSPPVRRGHQGTRTPPIETFSAIGNDSLKPERSTEWETGFDFEAVREPPAVRRDVLTRA